LILETSKNSSGPRQRPFRHTSRGRRAISQQSQVAHDAQSVQLDRGTRSSGIFRTNVVPPDAPTPRMRGTPSARVFSPWPNWSSALRTPRSGLPMSTAT